MLRISDIKLGTDDTESDLRKKVLKLLGVKNVKSFEISKKSIDARKKPDIHYVYSVDVETDNEEYYAKKIKNSQNVKKKTYEFPKCGNFDKPVVIVGTGPAGLMCGLTLAQNGYKVILLERGKCVEERMKDVEAFWEAGFLNPESNVQFGEGGAGTFSDGKLTTGIKDFRIERCLKNFISTEHRKKYYIIQNHTSEPIIFLKWLRQSEVKFVNSAVKSDFPINLSM